SAAQGNAAVLLGPDSDDRSGPVSQPTKEQREEQADPALRFIPAAEVQVYEESSDAPSDQVFIEAGTKGGISAADPGVPAGFGETEERDVDLGSSFGTVAFGLLLGACWGRRSEQDEKDAVKRGTITDGLSATPR